jgi:glyoxylase-like metal-dependent hydrolase (beta-lactamase superfamily II)
MEIYVLNTGFFKLDGGAMFGVVPKSIWSRTNPSDSNNMCDWAMRSLLIKENNKLILIDTGIGNKQDDRFFSHFSLTQTDQLDINLNKLGFSRDDITDVFLTHLHFDHCGGSIKKIGDSFIPAFKNAIYWSNVAHWEWATMPNEREKASFLKENILPIKTSGQLQFTSVPTSHFTSSNLLHTSTFTKDILIRYVNGHTEKMMLPQINYKGQTIVFMADLLPSVGHLPIPYVMSYDMFPLTTLMEKKSFLQEALEKQYILFFEHDAVHECVRLIQTEKGIRAGEAFTLADL